MWNSFKKTSLGREEGDRGQRGGGERDKRDLLHHRYGKSTVFTSCQSTELVKILSVTQVRSVKKRNMFYTVTVDSLTFGMTCCGMNASNQDKNRVDENVEKAVGVAVGRRRESIGTAHRQLMTTWSQFWADETPTESWKKYNLRQNDCQRSKTRSKHKKVQKNAYLLWHGYTICNITESWI